MNEKKLQKWAEEQSLTVATFNLIHYKTHSETEIKSKKAKLERIKLMMDLLNKSMDSIKNN
jgi:uncharacterized FlaG/YvyC family protein|tara:strand:- start:478 stop:660 length:183 start_codon:yes stop_codon:yes gene_type:complete